MCGCHLSYIERRETEGRERNRGGSHGCPRELDVAGRRQTTVVAAKQWLPPKPMCVMSFKDLRGAHQTDGGGRGVRGWPNNKSRGRRDELNVKAATWRGRDQIGGFGRKRGLGGTPKERNWRGAHRVEEWRRWRWFWIEIRED